MPKNSKEPDLFFPRSRRAWGEGLKYCLKCDVREQCGKRGDELGARWGIWGGVKRTNK